jgi:Ca2+-transporting ATPase
LKVSTGDILPVDGIILESNDIQCDEAPMTGESDLIKKSLDRNPFMLSGCKVIIIIITMIVVDCCRFKQVLVGWSLFVLG